MTLRVEHKIGNLQRGSINGFSSATHCSDSCEELINTEWFYKIVISPDIETGHPIRNGASRGEHNDRRVNAGSPQSLADLKTSDFRKHKIENDKTVISAHRLLQTCLPVKRKISRIPFGFKSAIEDGRKLYFVLND